MKARLRIGYIPLVDAASLIVAADMGFGGEQGLDIELIREVSWSNVRDKLNIGLFDAAHLLAPVAIASSLGLGHLKSPLVAPFTLSLNGNAITVSPALHDEISSELTADADDPVATAQALAKIVRKRKARGADPVTLGKTFSYSTHNYQLRMWLAAGGIDPDQDVRLVVLPPPYMVESLESGQVDGFCVGSPWNGVAVSRGIGRILHFGPDILPRAIEKVLAIRQGWAQDNAETTARLIRALHRSASFVQDAANRARIVSLLARPDRVGAPPPIISAVLEGRMAMTQGGPRYGRDDYILFARSGAGRPDLEHAAWLFDQMVRWKQALPTDPLRKSARAVFRPDLYDAALGHP